MRTLALDVGDRRVGVAVSDPLGLWARPLTVLTRRSRVEDYRAIAQLVDEYEAEKVIVGHPLNLNGDIGPQADPGGIHQEPAQFLQIGRERPLSVAPGKAHFPVRLNRELPFPKNCPASRRKLP